MLANNYCRTADASLVVIIGSLSGESLQKKFNTFETQIFSFDKHNIHNFSNYGLSWCNQVLGWHLHQQESQQVSTTEVTQFLSEKGGHWTTMIRLRSKKLPCQKIKIEHSTGVCEI